MSLSQDDFRKLLATPRAVTASAPKKKAAGPPPQTPKPNVELAKPEVPKKKKKEWRRPDHGEEAPQIRDRAKERREGINPDYEDSEAILDRLTALASQAADESESARQTKAAVYQQSKYLGGDVKHTHLVKGLDFALLKKVRNEIGKAEEEEADDERLEEVFEKDYEETESKVESEFASRICKIALEKPVRPVRNDLFIPGRMAFVWDIANATTTLGTDPFIPTTVIRSRSDLKEDSRNAVSDSSIVIDKISQLISSVRFGKKRESDAGEMKKLKRKGREEQVAEPVLPAGPPLADDEDIFADAGRDYVLEVKERASRDTEFNLISSAKVYFVTMGEDVLAEAEKALEKEREDAKVASTAYNRSPSGHMDTGRSSSAETLLQHGVAMLNTLQGAGTAEKVVAKSAKVSAAVSDGKGFAFGRRGVVAYGEEEMEMEYQSDEGGDDEPNLDQVDLGSKANKRRQLTRFDFETEEEFVRYKESQVHMPKAAFLYGVKSADGRKKIGGDLRNKEAAKLNKEMQQLDKMMTEKYGQSLKGFGGGGGKRGESGGAGASGGEGGDHSAPSKKEKFEILTCLPLQLPSLSVRRAMRFTVPNNPYKILKAARARLPAQSQKSPAWMNALAKFPPGPFPMRQVVPSEVGQFISPGAVERFAHDQELASRNPHRSKRPRMNPHPLAVSSKPPLIVYPEDKLRERFYSEHPFEMTRPKSVLETEEGLEGRKTMKESLNDNWTNVSGEDVVRRAQFLMTAEGGGHKEETAYNLALALFYRVRSEEERMAEVERFRKKEQLKRAAAVSGTTAETTGERQGPAVTSPNAPDESEDEHFEIKWFRERETEEIEEGVRFAKEVQSRIDQRQKVQSEVAQFEARNRSQAASAASGSPSKP